MDLDDRIAAFLEQPAFAVVGASTDRTKYGNKVLRCYLQNGRDVVAVHPKETAIEGVPCYRSLTDIPGPPRAVSVITPPAISARVVREAAGLGMRHVWLQPGAEDDAVLESAREAGLDVISGGPCLLVALHYRES